MPNSSDLPSELALLRERQVAAWQSGERLFVETLLLRHAPGLAPHKEAVLDLICAEMLLREEAGEILSASEYCDRFPQWSDDITRLVEVHEVLGRLADFETTTHGGLNPGDDEPAAGRPAGIKLSADATPADSQSDRTLVTATCGAVASAPARTGRTSPTIPGYALLEEIGRGGMGVVYRARHLGLDRIVALKMIRDSALAATGVRERFRTEAQAVAKLQHPNIVQIFEYGEHEGLPFFSLEFVAGGSLEERLRQGRPSVEETLRLLLPLAGALDHAHQNGIVHRDLKPANILLGECSASVADGASRGDFGDGSRASDGGGTSRTSNSSVSSGGVQPKITDFGLAKSLAHSHGVTLSEAIVGTGAYMSPEQAWGKSRDVGPASDLFAFGVILYEALTGTSPFRAASLALTLDQIRFHTPPAPSSLNPDVSADLDHICLRCLEKEPANRYPSARELANDLERVCRGESISRVRRRGASGLGAWLSVVLTAVCAVGLFAAWWLGRLPTLGRSSTEAVADAAGSGSSPSPRTVPVAARTVGEKFAFLVGVRSYKWDGAQLDLEYTEADVDELSRLLLKRGYARKNIQLLTQWSESDNPELAPTGANIRRRLSQLLESCIPDDRVLIAITGMGGDLGGSNMYCYLPADANPKQLDSVITLNDFYAMLGKCRAMSKVLLVDTCQTVVQEEWQGVAQKPPEGLAILFACSPKEASFEHADLRHGVFSYHLLKGLDGAADKNGDGAIALRELYEYTRDGVTRFVGEKYAPSSQSPRMVSTLADSTPIVSLSERVALPHSP